jgi:hypothetical protein
MLVKQPPCDDITKKKEEQRLFSWFTLADFIFKLITKINASFVRKVDRNSQQNKGFNMFDDVISTYGKS